MGGGGGGGTAEPGSYIPIVSIVVPFLGLPYRILLIYLVKPKQGTTMETIGRGLNTNPILFWGVPLKGSIRVTIWDL